MKKIAILIENNYQVLEVWYPYLYFKGEGFEVKLVGTGSNSKYHSKEGYPVNEELKIDNVNTADFDGVIIPGGFAPDILRRYESVNKFVKDIFDQSKIVASICHGGWVLASSKILKGKKATCFFAIKDDIINAGAIYIDKEVVIDNNLITSRKPEDLPFFCKAIKEKLK